MAGRGRGLVLEAARRAVRESPSSSSTRFGLRTLKTNGDGLAKPTGSSTGHTIFALPGASQESVLDALRTKLRAHIPEDVMFSDGRAVVVLATPRHASWLTDIKFMSSLVRSLSPAEGRGRGPVRAPKLHVLAAVVDSLCTPSRSRGVQHGLSIQFGKLDSMLPGLWDSTADATQSGRSDPGPSYLSLFLKPEGKVSAVLPLANTMFQNGRRSTLLASEWAATSAGDASRPCGPVYKPRRAVEKRTQKVDLSGLLPSAKDKPMMRFPLLPITHPRMILEALGNILAKVEVEGQPSAASKELQANIPRWLEVRRPQPDLYHGSGPVGVWALIIPRDLVGLGASALEVSPQAVKRALLNFRDRMGWKTLGTATAKLAFEMSMEGEKMAWELDPFFTTVMAAGGRLHKILSGGGEWGSKASLLSLDPQSSYGEESEDAELERFQKSFYGDDSAGGVFGRPGDFVQFFVERDPDHRQPMSAEQGNQDQMRAMPMSSYPRLSFGVCDPSVRDEEHVLPDDIDSMRVQRGLSWVQLDHFGGLSAKGVYLGSAQGTQTKVDVPCATISFTLPYG